MSIVGVPLVATGVPLAPIGTFATFVGATLDSAVLSDRELVLTGGVVLAILYLAGTAFRGGPSRDRKGRFRSKRRGQFLGLLKIGIVVALLWLATAIVGFT